MKIYLFLLLSLLASTQGFTQKSKTMDIPFTMDRNLIIIQAQMAENTSLSFIFDTGTKSIMLWDSLANQYPVNGLDTIVTPQGEWMGTQETVLLPSISFGSLTLKKQTAAKMPRQMILSDKAVGIIGMQTFVGFTITIDYTNSKIILSENSLLGQADAIPVDLGQILEAKVKLNKKEVLAHFDCGAPGYIAIPKGWDKSYTLKGEAVLLTRGRTPMGDFDVFSAELDGKIEVGKYTITNPKVHLVTGDFFNSINFGYAFFKAHLISIDTKNQLMQIKAITPTNEMEIKEMEEIGQMVQNLAEKDRFSGTVLIAKGNNILFQKAVGYADKEKNIKNDIHTKFNLASMNKMFTAVAIAQLVEQKKIDFKDKVTTYLPYLPVNIFGQITIEQLLTHTAGTGDFFSYPKFMEIKDTAKTIAGYVDLGIREPLLFEPGARFEYSNYGYILLGAVIEHISKMSYFDYVKKYIFTVADMQHTDSYETDQSNQNMAIGYAMPPPMPGQAPPALGEKIKREANTPFIEVKGTSAGGGYSTAMDLLKFSQALSSGKLLSLKSVDYITKGKIVMPPPPMPPNAKPILEMKYAFGFGEVYRNQVRIIGHNGGAPGIEGQVDIYPDLGYTVIVLSNYDRSIMPIVMGIQDVLITKNQ